MQKYGNLCPTVESISQQILSVSVIFLPPLQLLYTECGQRLTEVEMRSARLPPVSTRVRVLEQQLEALQVRGGV